MHPVIRILSFLFLIALLVRSEFPFIFCALGLFIGFALKTPQDILRVSWRFIRRMRWFWFSILLLYTLLTPGEERSLILGPLELSLTGFWLGSERCLILLCILLYFVLLIHTTPVAHLQGALFWLLQPLQFLKISSARLCVRIALTVQTIQGLQTRWQTRAQSLTSGGGGWRDIPVRLETLISEAFIQAETTPANTEMTLETSAPGARQWGLFIALVAVMAVVRLLSDSLFRV